MNHLHLKHLDIEDHYQFVTFRTKESLDDYLLELYKLDTDEKIKRYLMDKYLDQSSKGALLNADISQRIISYYRDKEGVDFELIAVSVMPNHIHILFKQNTALPKIIQTFKGGAAHIVNKTLNRTGKVWSRDYFDRVIRNQDHFEKTYRYIQQNAIKANLKDANLRFFGIYE